MQEETTYLGIPCFTLRDNTERPITCELGTNLLLGLAPERIREVPGLIAQARAREAEVPPGWDGVAAERLVDVLLETDLGSVARARRQRSGSPAVGARLVTLSATSHDAQLAGEASRAAGALLRQAASQDWRGPDPYDGLYFRWPGWLTGGRRRRQAIVQAHARAPVDIRRLYRRAHPQIAKALGVFGSVGMRLGRAGDPDASNGWASSRWGGSMPIARPGDVAWGYPFDVQTRWSFYPAGSPNVVVTSFAVQGLLEGAAAARSAAPARAGRRGGALGAGGPVGASAAASSPITRRRR